MFCAICCYLYNSKNVKNNQREVLPLVLLKATLLLLCFSRFLNWTYGTNHAKRLIQLFHLPLGYFSKLAGIIINHMSKMIWNSFRFTWCCGFTVTNFKLSDTLHTVHPAKFYLLQHQYNLKYVNMLCCPHKQEY